MHPSPRVLAHGQRLSREEFATQFRDAWSRLQSRFLKLECWQAYQEQPHNVSQQAFQRGETDRARALLRQEAEKDRRLYQDIETGGLDYARIRVVQAAADRLPRLRDDELPHPRQHGRDDRHPRRRQ